MTDLVRMLDRYDDYEGVWQMSPGAYAVIFRSGGTYYIQTLFPGSDSYGDRDRLTARGGGSFCQPSSGESFVILSSGNLATYADGDYAGEWTSFFPGPDDDIDEAPSYYVVEEEEYDYDDDDEEEYYYYDDDY